MGELNKRERERERERERGDYIDLPRQFNNHEPP